jgi:SMC interacting uncharacterized protein involved in chromosome segregation
MNEVLQQLEDKVVSLVDELERLRSQVKTTEAQLKAEQAAKQELAAQLEQKQAQAGMSQEKLQGIMSLLESVDKTESTTAEVATEVTAEQHTETVHIPA